MKRLAIIFVVAAFAGISAHRVAMMRLEPEIDAAQAGTANGRDISWLRAEFRLSDAQFSAIRDLHDAYGPQCGQHCADIIEARTALDTLLAKNNAAPEEITNAKDRLGDLEAICNNATRDHLRRVATLMPEKQGARFLRLVEPHLADTPHDGSRFPERKR